MPARRRCAAPRGRARQEKGAVAVEFALVFPLLVMLLLGTTTAGLAYSRAVGLANATREGARFGSTADACGGASSSPPCSTSLPGGSAWADDTIRRVRATQFDDAGTEVDSSTTICVQLFKKTGSTTAGGVTGTEIVTWTCSVGGDGAPTVTTPATANDAPKVPTEAPDGACVVRIVTARYFTISAVLANWTRTNMSRSVARYERTDRVEQCI